MKPSTPKGTRDFLPAVVRKRNYIFDTIRGVFEKFGYEAIETPAMENLETLTGKYGDEGDRLIFKILNRDQKLEKALSGIYDSPKFVSGLGVVDRKGFESDLADGALRYDLTVPFARFVVQHQNELAFPFRRYQIQPVWRADRPQKGRYREFYQCDADVVGTDSLRCEVEFVQIFDDVFEKFGVPVEILINNRKILSALAQFIGAPDKLTALTVALDKLDKQHLDDVLASLENQGFSVDSIQLLKGVVLESRRTEGRAFLNVLKEKFADIAEGQKGIEELEYIFEKIDQLGLKEAELTFELSLARGLNYYTGAIFEVLPDTDAQVGSICGGGRYDDLTGIFGMPGMSGVGISFGADRIYDLLEAISGFPTEQTAGTELMFVNFGEREADYCHQLLGTLRSEGVRAELYPDAAKMKKQMKYANDKEIPFVAIVGANEIENNTITLKNMTTGEQDNLPVGELVGKLRNV